MFGKKSQHDLVIGRENFLKNFFDALFIFAVVLIVFITIVIFYQFNKLVKANDWVDHTYEVIFTATNSINTFNYLQAKQREYVLFDDQEALQDFYLNSKKLTRLVQDLITLTVDNPIQQKKIQNLLC